MNKATPSPGRVAVMVGFTLSCFALLLFLWLSFGGSIPLAPKGYRIRAAFPEATQLAEQADVRIAGVSVGKVIKKELDPKGNRTMAFIELKPEFAPLHKDAKATLRQKTLLGETYVELSPGSKDKPPLHDGGLLDRNRVKRTVELDEIFEALDPRTRQAYRTWMSDLAASFKGRGQDLNDTIGNLPQFASTADDTLRVLDVEHAAVTGLVRDTGRVFGALSADPARLRSLVTSSERVFSQTAARNDDLAATIRVFPTFLDETRFTLARLERFAHNTDPLIRDLQPAVRDLVPTLRDLRRLAPHLHKLFVDLDPLITVSQTGLPAVRKTLHGARPVLGELGPFLGQLNPILQWLGLNQHLVADFMTVGAGGVAAKTTSASGGTGHYLRQFQPKGPETFGFYNQRLETNRANPYLPPLGLALPQLFKELKFPAWDCKNAPPAARNGAIEEGPNRQIGCFEAQDFLPNFHKQGTNFPHITPNSYKAKK